MKLGREKDASRHSFRVAPSRPEGSKCRGCAITGQNAGGHIFKAASFVTCRCLVAVVISHSRLFCFFFLLYLSRYSFVTSSSIPRSFPFSLLLSFSRLLLLTRLPCLSLASSPDTLLVRALPPPSSPLHCPCRAPSPVIFLPSFFLSPPCFHLISLLL